ncbi:MAG: hypothetical protein ACOC0P_02575 [Planctomycetota bacterium]
MPVEDQKLVEAYLEVGVPSDQLQGSEFLDEIVLKVRRCGDERSPEELLRRIINLRKSGRLPRLVRVAASAPSSKESRRRTELHSGESVKNRVIELLDAGAPQIRIEHLPDGNWRIIV